MKKFAIGILLFLSALCGIFAAGCEKKPQILDAPQNIRVENNVLIWDEVENASGYSLYVELLNIEKVLEDNRFDFSTINANFSFAVEILAIGDGKNYLNSDWVEYICNLSKKTVTAYPYSYELNKDGTGFVARIPKTNADELYIPDYHEGLPVKEIGRNYDSKNQTIKRIRLPATLEKIGEKAFAGYSALEQLELPEGLTSIGESAFDGCKSLTAINLPSTLESIESSALGNCTSLRGVGLPEGLKTIGGFSGCTALSFIQLPSTLKTIGYHAFSGCTALTGVELPEGLETIGYHAFSGCTALTGIEIPESITEIKQLTFENCTALRSIRFPATLETIGDSAFRGCTSLTDIKLPDNVTVGAAAFQSCAALKRIDCSSCTAIDADAFAKCSSLTEIIFPKDACAYNSQAFTQTGWYENQPDGFVIVNGDTLLRYKGSVPNDGVIDNFPAEIKYIAAYAFGPPSYWSYEGSDAVSIEIPDGVQLCGERIFDNCKQLKQIKLPYGIDVIPALTFSSCRALESVIIPESVTKIEQHAFSFCKSLTEITLSSTLEEIGKNAFSHCPLKKVYFPDSLKSVDRYAFDGQFSEVILPATLNTINENHFNADTVIYYKGTQADKNNYFAEVTYNGIWYFYVENEDDLPADGGNYWHFDTDGTTPVIWDP